MDSIVKIHEPAPQFELPDLVGNLHSLQQYRGQIVLLYFWSAECPWVKRADEQLLDFLEELDEKVVLLPVASNANEGLAQLKAVSQERGLPVVLHDATQQVARLYGALATPHFFLIDARGQLSYQGALDDVTFRQREPTCHYAREAVTAVLDGREPPFPQSTPYGCTLVWEM